MKLPTPSPGEGAEVRDLIAQCLQLYEERGPRAVDEVLASHPDSSHFVRERLDLLGRMGLIGDAPEDAQPEHIGGYRIVDVLGRGGMGVVYEAEQERPRRRVALKVLRSWPGEKGRHRFEHESELLARLQHPGIATIHEVGTALVGGMTAPFFAMELVRGAPVDQYADEHGLDSRERLELLAKIADAVHHAHLKGVVHRDLKPANVMVDERGAPRVLDFGIARAIDPDLQLETLRTEVGQLVGTLAYMSPEQAAGDPDEIDARCDVYALGVIGYELLAGRLPVELEGRSAFEVLQAIRDEDPPPLGQIDRALRGDVETIVATALAKEKERRYESAHELAADIRRYLAHEPIAARPSTAAYQLGKFARRHKALVAGAAVAVLALVLGLAGTSYGLVQAETERAKAEREHADAERRFEQAKAVLDFQRRMFATADPSREGIQVADMLDRATLQVEDAGADLLEEAAVRLMLGEAYLGIGEWENAEPLLSAAIEVFERELGAADLQTLAAKTRLAGMLNQVGRYEDAREVIQGVESLARREHGDGHDSVLAAQIVLANILKETGDYAGSIVIVREVERAAPTGHPSWYEAQRLIAVSSELLGDYESAVAAARLAYDLHLEAHGEEHPGSLRAMETYGVVLLNSGRPGEALPIVERELELRVELLGEEHPDTLRTMANAGALYSTLGEPDRAEEVLRRGYVLSPRVLPAGHPTIMHLSNNLGAVLGDLGRYEEAESLFRATLALETEVRGLEHPNTTAAMGNLAVVLQHLNRMEDAEALLVDALDARRQTLGDRHPNTLLALHNLAVFYVEVGDRESAAPLLREASKTAREILADDDLRLGEHLKELGRNLMALGDYQEAESALLEASDVYARALGEDHPKRIRALETLRTLYTRWDKPELAAAYDELLGGR